MCLSHPTIHALYDSMMTLTGNARALADEGQPSTQRPSPSNSSKLSPVEPETSPASASSLQPPSSPNQNRRMSLTPGGTTKVLADLQTGVVNARNALENTKAQLRLSQRGVAQLTRQTEDLKEVRERLRLENEGLNNVVARKERLLQEVSQSIHLFCAMLTCHVLCNRYWNAPEKQRLKLRPSRPNSKPKRPHRKKVCKI